MAEQQYDHAREEALRWRDHVDARMQPQDYPGLDAAGFLLVALGHLVKAREKLEEDLLSLNRFKAAYYTRTAANCARYALKLLDEQKEEPCEKS